MKKTHRKALPNPALLRFAIVACALAGRAAWPQFDSGSTGADGEFHPTVNTVVDLNQKPDGIFNYTTITIPAGVTVTFTNNAANRPVTWLASGDVTIAGTVNLNGAQGSWLGIQVYSTPGPGGYSGGFGKTSNEGATNGFGPGGGRIGSIYGRGAGHATVGAGANAGPAYGNVYLLPLQGGSGGAGGGVTVYGGGGGAGGGALLLASTGKITVDGAISTDGGGGGGNGGGGASGGAIRLVANEIRGNGSLKSVWGRGENFTRGSYGRIRREAFVHSFTGTSDPTSNLGAPGLLALPNTAPSIRIGSIDGVAAPLSPTASLAQPDLSINQPSQSTINIAAKNIPLGTTAQVTVIPALNGSVVTATSTPLAGTLANSTATASIALPIGVSQVFVSAQFTAPEGMGEAKTITVASGAGNAGALVRYFNTEGELIVELSQDGH